MIKSFQLLENAILFDFKRNFFPAHYEKVQLPVSCIIFIYLCWFFRDMLYYIFQLLITQFIFRRCAKMAMVDIKQWLHGQGTVAVS